LAKTVNAIGLACFAVGTLQPLLGTRDASGAVLFALLGIIFLVVCHVTAQMVVQRLED